MMRITLRHVMGALCGAALLPACSDDAASSQDTNASSGGTDAETTGATDPDTTPMTETGTDTGNGPATLSGADSTSDTVADTTAGTTGTTECLLPVESVFADHSFEAGDDTPWGIASSGAQSGNPLCTMELCDAPAQDGEWYAWFGNWPNVFDVAGVAQEVVVPAGDRMGLTFGLRLNGTGFLGQVLVDGELVFEVTEANVGDYAEWTDVDVDISAYADGNAHQFDFVGSGPQNGGVMFDNIRLQGCERSSLSAGDSVDPPVTTSAGSDTDTGETGGETFGMLTMCDNTIDNTQPLPIVVTGDNTGGGNEVTGTCVNDSTGSEFVYEFTAPADGVYSFDTLASTGIGDSALYIYDGCVDGVEVACNDDSGEDLLSQVVYTMTEGQIVAVVIDGFSAGNAGEFTLTIDQVACDDTPIDLRAEALPVENRAGNTMTATNQTFGSCGGGDGVDIHYVWTAPSDGMYTIDTIGSAYATALYAYAAGGTCGDPGSEAACDANGALSRFTTAFAANDEITIVVDDADPDDGFEGTAQLNISEPAALEGACCEVDDSVGCESVAVTQCVCNEFPECCSGDEGWNQICAGWAGSNCEATGMACETVAGGSCCMAGAAGGCDVDPVESCVCGIRDTCCSDAWNETCVFIAENICFADCG